MNHIRLIKIHESELDTYTNLARSYEAEFSNLTGKMPNEKGIFEPDTMPISPYEGYLLYQNNTPIGFCVVEIRYDIHDVTEFYIIPSMRRKKLGYALATTIFEMYPSEWQVRQIEKADAAKDFWRNVIKTYTQNQFQEEMIDDPDWGYVTRQRFVVCNLGLETTGLTQIEVLV